MKMHMCKSLLRLAAALFFVSLFSFTAGAQGLPFRVSLRVTQARNTARSCKLPTAFCYPAQGC